MDYTNIQDSQNMRIDARILKHLLQEASDLLEEAQTHALIEKQCEINASTLAQANWRMTATCIWAISELFPSSQDSGQAAQLHAPAPIFSRIDEAISPQLSAFILRVDRLHERAQRLDKLSRGPTISSEPADETHPAGRIAGRESASIIPLFGSGFEATEQSNSIEKTRLQMRRAMAGHD